MRSEMRSLTPMRVLSVCSGIEAASAAWGPLGWRTVAVSEIDKHASAVLAHHYPDVPNFGDMTRFQEWPDLAVDVLVGGTPCQDLSVAGKRAGLAGERSGLFHDFVDIANRYRPRYIVWENVPGALSTNEGDDLRAVFDAFTEIGYVCDADICDAQYFGLAQRRRRLFVVCVRLDGLLTQRTPTSERMAAELLLQPLLDTWAGVLQAWCPDRSLSGYAIPTEQSAAFATRRMQLLEKALDGSACTKLLAALGASPLPVTEGPRRLASTTTQPCETPSPDSRTGIGGFPSWSMDAASGNQSTGTSWSDTLAALSGTERGSTTSTSTATTTESTICTFAGQSLSIVRYIIDLRKRSEQSPWSVDCWNLASLLLTTLEAVTKYAGQAASDLFGEPTLRDDWRDHLNQARALAIETQRHLGNRQPSDSIYSLPESLRGDSAPRREAGEGVAPCVTSGAANGGAAHGARSGSAKEGLLTVTHALTGEGFDASEDGTGRGTPLVPQAFYSTEGRFDNLPPAGIAPPLKVGSAGGGQAPAIAFSCKDHGADAGEIAPTLRAMGHDGSHANAGGQIAVAFDTTQVTSRANRSNPKAGDPCHPLAAGAHAPAVAFNITPPRALGRLPAAVSACDLIASTAVRRLTPRECERLQGFPDDYSLVAYRGKPMADGPRYKMLGNSMAVPVMAWIGARIDLVRSLTETADAR